jgi:hypothetical protein
MNKMVLNETVKFPSKDEKSIQYAALLLSALDLALKHDLNYLGDSTFAGRQRAAAELVLWAIGEPPTL